MTVNPYEPTASPGVEAGRARRYLHALASVSLCVYLSAFFLPVFDSSTSQVMYGYEAFVFAIASVKFIPTWLANPLYWVALKNAYQGNVKTARMFAIAAPLLAVCQVWMMDDAPEAGFYLWLGSLLVFGLGTFVARECTRAD